MDTIKISLPSKPKYVTTLRLLTASIGQLMEFNIEEVEDLRVCIAEAVNYLLPYNDQLEVIYEEEAYEEDRLQLRISICADYKDIEEEEHNLHRMILESLMDQVDYEEGKIILVKKCS